MQGRAWGFHSPAARRLERRLVPRVGGGLTAGLSTDGTAYESASEPREPESFFPFLISQFNSFVFSIPSLYSLCFPDSITWMGR